MKKDQSRIKQLFAPSHEGSTESFVELIPIFIMVTFVMVVLYVTNILASSILNNPLRLIFVTLLFVLHLSLYWMILNFVQTEKRTLYYLIAQGLLAFVIVLLSENIYLAIGLFSSISGTAVGMLGRNRLVFMGVGFYIVLALLDGILLSSFVIVSEYIPVLLGAIAFAAFFAFLFQRQVEARERAQNLLKELEAAHTQLAEYMLEVENLTLVNERQRMARELHDTLAQGLAGLILQLEAADSHISAQRSQKAQEIIQMAMGRARTTLADARRAIGDLRGTQSPTDFAEDVREETERFTHDTGIPCALDISVPETLSPQIAEISVRAISEGLINIARHANATQASVRLAYNEDNLEIEIRDNGVGFDAEESVGRSGHYGLLGMRERARISGGSLVIESAPALGTSLKLKLPLSGNDD
jgi:NarL family two-component system sensor histidine kinase YdfH